MKTLKQLKKESELFYSENASTYFAVSFNKKMCGTQTITFENDFLPKIRLDKCEYYSGRGAKYNTTSMHEHIDVFVTVKQFNDRVNSRAKILFEKQQEEVKNNKLLKEFCKKHGLNVKNYYAVGTDGLFFKFEKKSEIEKELNVDLTDFLNASGKTYFFIESKIGLLEFYHNHRQSYSFYFATPERKNEFDSDISNWINAPYANLVGQNDNPNLFVC